MPTAVSVLTNVFCNGCSAVSHVGVTEQICIENDLTLVIYCDISFFPLMAKCNMKNSGLFDDDVTYMYTQACDVADRCMCCCHVCCREQQQNQAMSVC